MVAGLNPAEITIYPVHEDRNCTLKAGLEALGGDPPDTIPLWVWLLENPESPIPFPGKISLHRHDCLHVLLGRGFSPYDEAFVVGFTLGNDPNTRWVHIAILKLFAYFVYPAQYRFHRKHLQVFTLGVAYGRAIQAKNLHQVDFSAHHHQSIQELRDRFGIEVDVLKMLLQVENLLQEGV